MDFLTDTVWAFRSTYHTILRSTPGAAIFGRDMLYDIPYLPDWTEIGRRRQTLFDQNCMKENKRRIDFDYTYPNSQVKMAEPRECDLSQDEKIQGTCTKRSVQTNDVTSSDNVKNLDIRTKVSVCMSDVTPSNIVQDKDISHVPLESNQHRETLAYQA